MKFFKKYTLREIIFMALVVLLSVIFMFPFYWIATGAFKPQNVTVQIPPEWWPKNPTLQNFKQLSESPLLHWTLNSFIISLGTMLIVCTVATMAGFVLAKKVFPGRNLIFWSLIVAMALPKQVVMIPLFTILSKLDWINTYQALILPAAGWPFGVFLMKQFSQGIPGELLEAAKIDGCTELRSFWSIVIPMVKPGVGALAIFTFINAWNDYFMQLIIIRSEKMMTLPLGVALLQQEFTTNYGVIMAGAALASLPMIIVFIIFQKYFTQGITMGAVKG
ncbi:carbohydrate ABC transporter permease [Ruminiclostridium papyrosolvens]|uniref:ABC transporter permease n=1 Tax=Ruminiclostridium papyrosolvens C7 TaxID=1330534 RepID=U4QZD0_9FIRM|nr:carbohydrate ABC transporter permease [Ruminiclostridium papyrosolvens]EPR10342.1 ABC transporter permease [Ruminiclostridium papyrosolvens C7]